MLITEATGMALDDERLTPNLLAESLLPLIADLQAQLAAARTKGARRSLNSRLKAARFLLRWAKGRAGYVAKA